MHRDASARSGMSIRYAKGGLKRGFFFLHFFNDMHAYCTRVIFLRSRRRVMLVRTRGINCVGRDAYEGN